MKRKCIDEEAHSENEDSEFAMNIHKASYKKWEQKENTVYVQFL